MSGYLTWRLLPPYLFCVYRGETFYREEETAGRWMRMVDHGARIAARGALPVDHGE